jgi:hypothetical protein
MPVLNGVNETPIPNPWQVKTPEELRKKAFNDKLQGSWPQILQSYVSVVIGLILYDEFEQCTWVHISLI